jgi:hypothetical protein
MPWVGFEPTIPVFERAKIFHALDGAATVIGLQNSTWQKFQPRLCQLQISSIRGFPLVSRFANVDISFNVYVILICVHTGKICDLYLVKEEETSLNS